MQIHRMYAYNPRLAYLAEEDRYLTRKIAPTMTFNVIGTGVNGQEHIRNTLYEGHATIKGIYDPHPNSQKAAKDSFAAYVTDRELVIYQTLEEACNDPEVDGLIIATPNYTHIEVIRTAAASGKHILMEKPMATTIADAWEITQIAAKHPAVFQIGLQYRYKSIYTEAIHEALERKSIGEIKAITITEQRIPFIDKVHQWNKFSEYSGDTLVEKCCHYFDLFNLFAASRPVKVYASGSQDVNFTEFTYDGKASDILDNAMVIVDYANGIRANFMLCMFSPMFYEELVLCGDQGRLKVSESQDFLTEQGVASSMQIHCGESMPARISTPKYPSHIEALGHSGATFFEHRNFVDNIMGRPTNTATVADGFWSVVIGAAAQRSIRTGEPVYIETLLSENGITAEDL